MAYLVSTVYAEVCKIMLEDSGLALVYTEASFLKDLHVAIRRFCQETGMIKDTATISGVGGTSVYVTPDYIMEIQKVFWNGTFLRKSYGFPLDEVDPRWESDSGVPMYWREDKLTANKIQLDPTPPTSGTIMVIGTIQPNTTSIGSTDPIPLVPDSFCWYLKYFVLEKIWSSEGESRDMQRAAYCRARIQEAIMVAKAIMNEEAADTV